jgi:Integrase
MAYIRKRRSGTYEIVIKHHSLPQPINASADTEAQARAWAEKVEAQIRAGTLPGEYYLDRKASLYTVAKWLGEYESSSSPSASDIPLLPIVAKEVGSWNLNNITQKHLADWITAMKARKLTPGSIKKRVGCLARAVDIAVYRELVPVNVIRALPRNYAAYTPDDGVAVTDTARDRRLEPGEEDRIRAVMVGQPDFERLFTLALETAMRLSEMYTLTWDQVDIPKRTIFLSKTKNGDKRQVPMSSVVVSMLEEAKKHRERELVFPWFCGDTRKTTLRLSYHWRQIFTKAGCPDLHFHDCRHEATCRLFERTTLTDIQISLITGHRDPRMLRRYSNLRGSDLAARLW